jgi:2OG-Fe(II) oxygenase superfamily
MDQIKIVSNFISSEDIEIFKSYNDYLLETKPELFFIGNKGKRPVLQFGRDNAHAMSSPELDSIIPEIKNLVRSYFLKTTEIIKDLYQDNRDLYVCSFWLAKQLPGANVQMHDDTDEGANTHFAYSAVLYLNTLRTTGDLIFNDLGYSVKPIAGDLVIFPSQTTGNHEVAEIDEHRYTMPIWITADKEYAL